MNASTPAIDRLLAVGTLFFVLGTCAPQVAAQPAAPAAGSAAPRIGLALSGGGARGLAHVGVLKVLD